MRGVLVFLVRLLAFMLLPMFALTPAFADRIDPDRPEVTESAKLVPRGSVQLETGVAVSKERRAGEPSEHTLEFEAEFRIGITRQLELDVEWEPFVRVRGPQDDSGIGDVTIALRYRFVEGFEEYPWPPHVAVMGLVKLPVADEPIGTGRPDFGLLLLASFELPWDFELEVNVGAAAIGQTRPNSARPWAGPPSGTTSPRHSSASSSSCWPRAASATAGAAWPSTPASSIS